MATAVTTAPSNGTAVQKPAEREMEFIPFMEKDPIKLSVAIVKNLICVPTKSGKRCDDNQAVRFMMLCRARQLNPFAGDAFLIGYDGRDGAQFSLITAHQAFLKRAEVHPEYDGMESGVIVKARNGDVLDREGDFAYDGEELLGGWAVVFFKNRSHPMKRRLKLATFKKNFGRWNEDPAGMIVKCAESDALRSSFPTQLGGMYLDEELPRDLPDQRTSSPPIGRQRMASITHTPTVEDAAVETPTGAPQLPEDLRVKLDAEGQRLRLTKGEWAAWLERFGAGRVEDLTADAGGQLLTALQAEADPREPGDEDGE